MVEIPFTARGEKAVPGPIFVSFEGGEGAGKSTQAEVLHERLWAAGIQAILVREPGTTPLGWHLRDYLKSKQPLSKEAELLLFETARSELVTSRIKPSLDDGFTVIADRFEASSIAYQGYGRRIDLSVVQSLNSFATRGIYPDVTFFLDLEPEEGLRRVGYVQLALPLDTDTAGPGRQDAQGHRRFEDQALKFHQRVRQGYLDQANENPNRWVIIDATLPPDEISKQIWQHVLERLELPSNADYPKQQPLL